MTIPQHDFFTPEQVDTQIDNYLESNKVELPEDTEPQLVQRLQKHYLPDEVYELALKRVQLRLEQSQALRSSASSDKPEDKQKQDLPIEVHPGQFTSHRFARESKARSVFSRRLGLLSVAALFLILLGGTLLVLQQASSNVRCKSSSAPSSCTANSRNKLSTPVPQLYAVTFLDASSSNETLYRLDPNTDKTLWSFSMQPVYQHKGSTGSLSFNYAWEPHAQVVNGILYLKGTASDGYYIYALDASNGSLVWKYHYDASPYQDVPTFRGPLVANGIVYLTEWTSTNYGQIIALNASTGKLFWKQPYGAHEPELIDANSNTLYVTSWPDQGMGWVLCAFDARTGKKLWQKDHNSDEESLSWQMANGVLYATGVPITGSLKSANITNLYAYDGATGNEQWSKTLAGVIEQTQVVQNTIYATTFGHSASDILYALKAGNGSVIWQQDMAEGSPSLTIADGEIYAVTCPLDANNAQQPLHMEAFRASDGHVDWQSTRLGLGWAQEPGPATWAVDGHFLYLGAFRSNTVSVLDRSSGNLVKTFTVGNGVDPFGGSVTVFSLTD